MILDKTILDHLTMYKESIAKRNENILKKRRETMKGRIYKNVSFLLLKLQLIFERKWRAMVEREGLPKLEFQHYHLLAVTVDLVYQFFLP